MTHLGVYYAPEHSRQSDRDYIAALQPPVIRLLDPDVQQIADMHALAPNAIIAPRTWIIDDNSGAAVRNLMADPIGTGRDHANQYRGQVERWQEEARQRGLNIPGAHQMMFNAANEPNQGGTPDKIAAYNVAFLDRCTELNIRAAALCLGVGWPDNTGPDTPVDWTPYASLPAAIKRGNHWLDLHEYHYKTGPQDGWRWLAGRHLQCPFDVPILLGEIGVDNYVDKPRWDREGGNRGWQGNVSPDQYAEMIEHHITHSDRRVVAGLIFITDYRNNEWQNFDTNAAHNALLARKDRMVPQSAPPSSPGPQRVEWDVMWVNAPSGAVIRVRPNASSEKVTAVAYGEPVEVSGSEVGAEGMYWSRVRYQGATGWLRGDLLSAEPPVKPEPTPQPSQQGDTWSRAWPIVLKIEGGLSTDRSDKGNYRPDGTFVGTKWGISALSHPTVDIINLTKEDALKIYHQNYWLGGGCDRLEWPLCLVHFDAYVQNQNAAKKFLAASNGDPVRYIADRIDWYTGLDTWANHGRGWMRRCATMLREAVKSK